MSGRALVIDATHLLTRGAQVVSPDRRAPDGAIVHALYAATRALRRALEFKTPRIAVAVREREPPVDVTAAVRDQHARLPWLFGAHGVSNVAASGAIHVVASYASAALASGMDVVVVGSDKRLAQLVTERCWWYDAYKDVRYTPELVRKRFEVGPERVDQWLALVGDDDTLPGVKGLGKKSATELLEAHGSIERALAGAAEIGGRVGKALRAGAERVPVELARARLSRDRPLPEPLDALPFRAPDPDALRAVYAELGFVELYTAAAEPEPAVVEVCADVESLSRALATFDPGRPVALHPVVEDPSPARGALVGLALAQSGGPAFHVPMVGIDGERRLALEAWLRDPARSKVGHDVKAAIVALSRVGLEVAGVVGDSACASHLREPSNWATHDLGVVAPRVLGRALPDDDAVRGVGRGRRSWARTPLGAVASHAGQMAEASAALWDALGPATDRALLEEYLALGEVLVGMELRGIACDADDLSRSGEDFERIGAALEARVHELAGRELNLGSTKQLGALLFEELGLPIVKRTKTGWSTATEALERIESAHPIVPLVIRWRLLRRLKDSWVTALRAAIDDDGRVRSTFHHARSFSGRLVNSSPDLGRVPGKTEEMQRIRRAFRVPDGHVMLSVDYRQLGLYVLAHLTEDPALVEPLRAGEDMHALTAAAVLEQPLEAIDADRRQVGKLVNFATFAGQGASALALQLGVPAQEAKLLIERFDRRYAVVRAFQERQLEHAREHGHVVTIAGRRWPISDLRNPDVMIRSYAERLARRATHEGSVADVTRRGLLHAARDLGDAGLRAAPLLQVHDEVLFEVPEEELADAARVAAAAFRGAYDLAVPLEAGCKAGPSWAELEPWPASADGGAP